MAIAYFIPDQAQLLARSYQQTAQQAATSQRTSSATPAPQPGQQQAQAQAQQSPSQQQQQRQPHRPQFRANISVPLGRQQGSMTMSEFGCWDLLAQIFCYALRIYSYNSSQRRPTVIQISFEISGGSQDNGEEDDDDVTDATSTNSKDN